MTHAIAMRDLSLGYRDRAVVLNLNTRFNPGSLTAVVGPNGAGKSTLLKAIAGSLPPLSGSLCLGATSPLDIAYLPQLSELDRSVPIRVLDLVSMGLWREIGAFGGVRRIHRTRIADALATVGLTGLERRAIGSLSGGQLQRALFARVLLQEAAVVLLDEPFAGVDARTVADLLAVISGWYRQGRTVLAVLHDDDTVRAHFPETLLLARELVAHGATADVLIPGNRFKARQMCEACDGPPHTCGRDVA